MTVKKRLAHFALASILSLTAAPVFATGTHGMENMHGMTDMHEGMHADGEAMPFGRPGQPDEVDRTIQIKTLDAMRFSEEQLSVVAGQTVRFVVTNPGAIAHEFVIGPESMQKAHQVMMRKGGGTAMHHGATTAALSIAPGETKTLVWTFSQPGELQIACHVPGHYQAGMVSKLIVTG